MSHQSPTWPGSLLFTRKAKIQCEPDRQHDHPGHRAPRPARQGRQSILNVHTGIVQLPFPRTRQACPRQLPICALDEEKLLDLATILDDDTVLAQNILDAVRGSMG